MRHTVAGILGATLMCCSLDASAQSTAPPAVPEQSIESRLQIDFHVSEDALAQILPPGWDLAVATSGPAKDCNLRLIFIDRMSVNGTDGKPLGKGAGQIVYLTVPMKEASGTGVNAQVVIAGWTSEATDAPGPFDVYRHAPDHKLTRATTIGKDGAALEEQTWSFTTPNGNHIESHVKYERVAAARTTRETTYISAIDPKLALVSKIDSTLNIARNASVETPDRVKDFSYKVVDSRFKALFDGTEKVLSIDFFPWMSLATTPR